MLYLESPSTDPAFNLALEQYVFDSLPRSEEYFMFWQNHNAIIVGRHQNTAQEINAAYVAQKGIQVVRRLSGGGAVYHDLGNLNFTYVVDAAASPKVDLRLFCTPVALALSRMGVSAQVSGRNDITIEGKKFSGNAQYVREGRVMHHGTILFDSDLSVISQALQVSAEKLTSKGVASVRSRVTNVKPYLPQDVTLPQFKQRLLAAMFEGAPMDRRPFTPQELQAVEDLRAARYATWDWNYGASPAGTLRKCRRIEGCGSVEVYLTLDRGRIQDLSFRGDWFGEEEPETLLPLLRGLPLDQEALTAALSTVDVSRCFIGLTAPQLAALIAQ